MKYSIVIPCYNEAENLPTLINRIKDFSKKRDIEFILVENGSKDESYQLMRTLVSDLPFVKIVKIDTNQGYGYGLYQGIKRAAGNYIGWIHADMQLDVEDLAKFLDYIDSYKGKQKLFLKGIRHNRSFTDYVFTYLQGLFDSILYGMWLFDISAIPSFFDRSLLTEMKNVPNDFSIEIYIYVLVKKNVFCVKRLPVYLAKRKKGKSSWNTGFCSRIRQSIRIIRSSIKIKKTLQ